MTDPTFTCRKHGQTGMDVLALHQHISDTLRMSRVPGHGMTSDCVVDAEPWYAGANGEALRKSLGRHEPTGLPARIRASVGR